MLVRVIDYSTINGLGDFALIYDFEILASALEAEREAATTYLSDISGHLTAEWINVSAKLFEDVASKVSVAMAQPGDAIVMSTHRRTGWKRRILGSVAEDVLRHARVPILLARAGDSQSMASFEDA